MFECPGCPSTVRDRQSTCVWCRGAELGRVRVALHLRAGVALRCPFPHYDLGDAALTGRQRLLTFLLSVFSIFHGDCGLWPS